MKKKYIVKIMKNIKTYKKLICLSLDRNNDGGNFEPKINNYVSYIVWMRFPNLLFFKSKENAYLG